MVSKGLRVKDEYALPIMACRSIRDEFEGDKKETLLEKFKEELAPEGDIKLTADYTAIWREIVDGKKVIYLRWLPNDYSSILLD